VKTKIVDDQGRVPNFGKLLVFRYFIIWVAGQVLLILIPLIAIFIDLVDVLFIFGRERRCLHDYIAGTWVINA
jgi:uncharacterized RDD family membrane protein YckC